MLTIRLSRAGRKKLPFFRVVLTEHTKPIKAGYQDILGHYDPIKHDFHFDAEKAKERITKGAQISQRVAKLAFAQTQDAVFKKFIVYTDKTRKSKKADESAGK